MKLKVDKEADALYLRLDESQIVESEEVSPGVVLDYNEANQVVGVELLRLSERSPKLVFSRTSLRQRRRARANAGSKMHPHKSSRARRYSFLRTLRIPA